MPAVVLTSSANAVVPKAGSEPYDVSKAAINHLIRELAIGLGPLVRVNGIAPGPIETEIWDQPDNDDPIYDGPKFSPEEVAVGIIDALGSDGFEHYVPDMKAVVDLKNADIDTYIAGAAAMAGS